MTSTEKLFNDGEFQVIRITEDLYEEAWKLFYCHYLPNENFSIGSDLWLSAQAIDEIQHVFNNVVRDGISFAARHIQSKQLASISCNKMLNPSTNCSMNEVFNKFTTPTMLHIGNMLDTMERTRDLYKEWQIDCVMEINFLATHKDFARQGLALSLAEYSIGFARQMLDGSIKLCDLQKLPDHVRRERPKAITAVFTSLYTQRIGEKLNFEIIYRMPYTEFIYNGRCYTDVLDPRHQCCLYEALKL